MATIVSSLRSVSSTSSSSKASSPKTSSPPPSNPTVGQVIASGYKNVSAWKAATASQTSQTATKSTTSSQPYTSPGAQPGTSSSLATGQIGTGGVLAGKVPAGSVVYKGSSPGTVVVTTPRGTSSEVSLSQIQTSQPSYSTGAVIDTGKSLQTSLLPQNQFYTQYVVPVTSTSKQQTSPHSFSSTSYGGGGTIVDTGKSSVFIPQATLDEKITKANILSYPLTVGPAKPEFEKMLISKDLYGGLYAGGLKQTIGSEISFRPSDVKFSYNPPVLTEKYVTPLKTRMGEISIGPEGRPIQEATFDVGTALGIRGKTTSYSPDIIKQWKLTRLEKTLNKKDEIKTDYETQLDLLIKERDSQINKLDNLKNELNSASGDIENKYSQYITTDEKGEKVFFSNTPDEVFNQYEKDYASKIESLNSKVDDQYIEANTANEKLNLIYEDYKNFFEKDYSKTLNDYNSKVEEIKKIQLEPFENLKKAYSEADVLTIASMTPETGTLTTPTELEQAYIKGEFVRDPLTGKYGPTAEKYFSSLPVAPYKASEYEYTPLGKELADQPWLRDGGFIHDLQQLGIAAKYNLGFTPEFATTPGIENMAYTGPVTNIEQEKQMKLFESERALAQVRAKPYNLEDLGYDLFKEAQYVGGGAVVGGGIGFLGGGPPGAAAGAATGAISGAIGGGADILSSNIIYRQTGEKQIGETAGLIAGIGTSIVADIASPRLLAKFAPESRLTKMIVPKTGKPKVEFETPSTARATVTKGGESALVDEKGLVMVTIPRTLGGKEIKPLSREIIYSTEAAIEKKPSVLVQKTSFIDLDPITGKPLALKTAEEGVSQSPGITQLVGGENLPVVRGLEEGFGAKYTTKFVVKPAGKATVIEPSTGIVEGKILKYEAPKFDFLKYEAGYEAGLAKKPGILGSFEDIFKRQGRGVVKGEEESIVKNIASQTKEVGQIGEKPLYITLSKDEVLSEFREPKVRSLTKTISQGDEFVSKAQYMDLLKEGPTRTGYTYGNIVDVPGLETTGKVGKKITPGELGMGIKAEKPPSIIPTEDIIKSFDETLKKGEKTYEYSRIIKGPSEIDPNKIVESKIFRNFTKKEIEKGIGKEWKSTGKINERESILFRSKADEIKYQNDLAKIFSERNKLIESQKASYLTKNKANLKREITNLEKEYKEIDDIVVKEYNKIKYKYPSSTVDEIEQIPDRALYNLQSSIRKLKELESKLIDKRANLAISNMRRGPVDKEFLQTGQYQIDYLAKLKGPEALSREVGYLRSLEIAKAEKILAQQKAREAALEASREILKRGRQEAIVKATKAIKSFKPSEGSELGGLNQLYGYQIRLDRKGRFAGYDVVPIENVETRVADGKIGGISIDRVPGVRGVEVTSPGIKSPEEGKIFEEIKIQQLPAKEYYVPRSDLKIKTREDFIGGIGLKTTSLKPTTINFGGKTFENTRLIEQPKISDLENITAIQKQSIRQIELQKQKQIELEKIIGRGGFITPYPTPRPRPDLPGPFGFFPPGIGSLDGQLGAEKPSYKERKTGKTKPLIQLKTSLFRKFAKGEKDIVGTPENIAKFKDIIASKGTFLGYEYVSPKLFSKFSRKKKSRFIGL